MINNNTKRFINLENLATFFGSIGHAALYIQAFKIIYLKSAYAVSLTGTLIALISMTFWLTYGVSKNVRPLVISNIFGLLGITLLIGSILYYGDGRFTATL